jgi:hypothetical protein
LKAAKAGKNLQAQTAFPGKTKAGNRIKAGGDSKAYDWNTLKETHIIHDEINNTPVLLVLSADNKSLFAFERPSRNQSLN